MLRLSAVTSFLRWLSSTEMFARPARQLPGKWLLFEFYTEQQGQLLNLKEEAIIKEGYFWEINFMEEGQLFQNKNLPVVFSPETNRGAWHVSRNFVALSPAENPLAREEFQYAVSESTLKLLKKNVEGQIQFFGFFRRIANQN